MNINDYTDGYGLISPTQLNEPKPMRSCDNGVLYLSEYYILLEKNNIPDFKDNWEKIVSTSFQAPGLLARAPDCNGDQEGPDNHYGLLAASVVLNKPNLPYDILQYGKAHWGWYNNQMPGTVRTKDGRINWTAFQWRQLQLLTAMLTASKQLRFYHFPLVVFTALVIATSCMNVDKGNSDARILSWLLILIMSPSSLLCRCASKLWTKRLFNTYPNGMKDVFNIYFGPEHPITILSVEI